MADLGSKGALKTSINGKIFTNTTFEVSAEDIRSSFEDTIDTLCGNVVVMPSYSDLSILVSSSSLEPGNIYVFPYETISLVGSSVAPMLNTSVPGYTTITEQIAIVAKDSSSFFGQARSLNHPKDIISYDFTDNVETTTSTARSGFIKYRRDTERNIETFFDFRNNYVARYSLSKAASIVVSATAKNKGDIIYYNVTGSTVSAGWYFVNISATNIVADAETNADTLSPISDFDQAMYGNIVFGVGETFISFDGTSVAYHQSLDSLSTNVIIQENTTDVLIVNSFDVSIATRASSLTIVGSTVVDVGRFVSASVVNASSNVFIKGGLNLGIFSSYSIDVGTQVNQLLTIQASDTKVGTLSSKIVSINQSSNNEVEGGCQSVFFIKDAFYNTCGRNSANITVFKGSNNTFAQSCTSIQIYGGSNNRFAQSCSLINMLGDRDEALGNGTSYVSPYSKMDNNTFGTSCENISFENIGGRGNTFGDECANLVFTNTAENNTWRLVGCDFCRGIRNKTFKNILHGASFIVPNQDTATITVEDWYVPQLFVGTHTPNSSAVGASMPQKQTYFHDGKRMTTTGNVYNSVTNPISIGYARAGWFWDMTMGESAAQMSNANDDGTGYNPSQDELMLHGIGAVPTNKAWQWTHNGYPLLINFMARVNNDGISNTATTATAIEPTSPTSDLEG